MDLNGIPFKLRFNGVYKLFNEIQFYFDELDRVIQFRIDQLQQRYKILLIFQNNFQSHIPDTLRHIEQYLKSPICQLNLEDSKTLLKCCSEYLKKYEQDVCEYNLFDNVLQFRVVIDPLPNTWKCSSWKNDEQAIINGTDNQTSKPKYDGHSFDKIYEKQEQLKDLTIMMNEFDCKIDELKHRTWMIDEMIIMLYNNCKEYWKFMINVDRVLYVFERHSKRTINPDTKHLQKEIVKVFTSVTNHLDLFSNSPNAQIIRSNMFVNINNYHQTSRYQTTTNHHTTLQISFKNE